MREQQLHQWAQVQLGAQVQMQALSGDASFRRYFRLSKDENSWMAVDASPTTEKNAEFIYIAKLLKTAGVLVPEVLASDIEQGFLLLSDLGDQLLLPLLNEDNVADYYAMCFEQIAAMQSIAQFDLPLYDAQALKQEMALFPTWFVEGLLDYKLSPIEHALIESVYEKLIASALEQPQVFVHRDYHSRNIMLFGKCIAAIDFQDAVKGPMTYDLVSILRDCYIEWPAQQVKNWAIDYFEKARQLNLIEQTVNSATFLRWFDWMGLQRHIKVLGIFARLSLRDNKHAYLNDLPLVMKYTLDVLKQYPDDAVLAEFLNWFELQLLPLAQQQAWGQA